MQNVSLLQRRTFPINTDKGVQAKVNRIISSVSNADWCCSKGSRRACSLQECPLVRFHWSHICLTLQFWKESLDKTLDKTLTRSITVVRKLWIQSWSSSVQHSLCLWLFLFSCECNYKSFAPSEAFDATPILWQYVYDFATSNISILCVFSNIFWMLL